MSDDNLPCHCCKQPAKWPYMPASDNITEEERWRCDEHVPRGCSCGEVPVDGNYDNHDPANWQHETDEQGRKLPCCEWWSL